MPAPELGNILPGDNGSRRYITETQSYPVSCLLDILIAIAVTKRQGALTINFAGGKPGGLVEWVERVTTGVESTNSKPTQNFP